MRQGAVVRFGRYSPSFCPLWVRRRRQNHHSRTTGETVFNGPPTKGVVNPSDRELRALKLVTLWPNSFETRSRVTTPGFGTS